ncbi:MAG: hypothetical protein F6J93_23555 [Oscillatoria sp. SIO1A7]|nr:hypothetical protein [Oscillatoria sp. SIO1A7]
MNYVTSVGAAEWRWLLWRLGAIVTLCLRCALGIAPTGTYRNDLETR